LASKETVGPHSSHHKKRGDKYYYQDQNYHVDKKGRRRSLSPTPRKEKYTYDTRAVDDTYVGQGYGGPGYASRGPLFIGRDHTRHTSRDVVPIYQNIGKDGSIFVISQDLASPRVNPLMEVFNAVRRNEGVRNEYIEAVLHRSIEILENERKSDMLDAQGKVLARDLEHIIESFDRLLKEKNREGQLQKFLSSSARAVQTNVGALKGKAATTGAPSIVGAATGIFQAGGAYGYIRELIFTMIRSGDFRELISESVGLVQDVLKERSKAGTAGATTEQPFLGRAASFGGVPTSGLTTSQGMATPLGVSQGFTQPQSFGTTGPMLSSHGLSQGFTQPQSYGTTGSILSQGLSQGLANVAPGEKVIKAEYEVKNIGTDQSGEPYVERTIFKETLTPIGQPGFGATSVGQPGLTSGGSGQFQGGYQQGGYQQGGYQPGANQPGDLIPRAQLVNRFINILTRLGSRDEYRKAVISMFKLFDGWGEQVEAMKYDPDRRPVDTTHFSVALREGRRLLEQFVGKAEMTRFKRHMTALYTDIKSDPELTTFFTGLRRFILSSIEQPNSLNNEMKRREASQIMDLGIYLLNREKWGNRFRELMNDMRTMLDNVRKDTHYSDFTNKFSIFIRDFALNSEGRPDLWVIDDSFRQFKMLMMPLLHAHLENIPIDRIEMASPNYDFVVEDLIFHAADVLPNHITLKLENEADLDLQNMGMDYTVHSLKLRITHIMPVINNLRFYYKKKVGFPKLQDWGNASFALRGSGLSLQIHWKLLSMRGLPPKLELNTVRCSIDDLYLKFSDVKHPILDRLLTGMFTKAIKKRLAAAITNMLQTKITQWDDKINVYLASRPFDRVKDSLDSTLKNRYESMQQKSVDKEKQKRREEYRERKHGKDYTKTSGASLTDSLKGMVKNMVNQTLTSSMGGQTSGMGGQTTAGFGSQSGMGYQQQSSGMGYQPTTSGMGYQQQTSGMGYQPTTSGFGYQQPSSYAQPTGFGMGSSMGQGTTIPTSYGEPVMQQGLGTNINQPGYVLERTIPTSTTATQPSTVERVLVKESELQRQQTPGSRAQVNPPQNLQSAV